MSLKNDAIEVKQLRFSYHPENPLISIEQWSVSKGEQIFLYGPSGSGKSTLLNLLCGILSPQSGEINLLDQPFGHFSSRQRDQFRARHIGVVFQEFNLIPFLTVKENILLAAYFAQQKNQQLVNERVRQIFSRLGLADELLPRRADELSVGQRQRVSIARALINQPEILIADEPTSALDTENCDEFMHLLLENAEQSACTVLFVSHDQGLKSHFSCQQKITDLLINN